MEIGKTFCGRTDGRTHLSSNLLGHRRGDDLKILRPFANLDTDAILMCPQKGQDTTEYGKTETTLDKLFSHISTYSVTEMYVLFPKNGNAKQTRINVDVK